MIWFEPFIIRALIAGVMMAAVASPIGSLMIWNRMAYFSETLSHASIVGILLGLFLGVNQNISVAVLVCVLAYGIAKLPNRFVLGTDLMLLIVGQTALCLGVVGVSYMATVRSDLLGYLFGDILSVTTQDLVFMGFLSLLCAFLLKLCWKKQVFIAVSPDLAQSHGINLERQSLLFMFLVALFVALAIKTTGLLLVSALLIIPPATARFVSKTPEQMAFKGSIVGILSIVLGVFGSIGLDAPTTPMCVIAASSLFIMGFIWHICHKKTT